MSLTKLNFRPPYYKRKPNESVLVYIRRVLKNIITMYPKAREHGLLYYFDTEYRRRISDRASKSKTKLRRQKRLGKFRSSKVKSRLKRELIERDSQCCNNCKSPYPKNLLSIDHVIALAFNGTNDLDNLQLLCEKCRLEKDLKDNKLQLILRNQFILEAKFASDTL